MNKVIGLTGGIASGKTTVSNYLIKQNIHVVDADKVARSVSQKGGRSYSKIVETFGEDIITDDGEIDRKKLGELIFNDADKRKALNNIVHPDVRIEMNQLTKEKLKTGDVVLDIPLLFENGLDKKCDLTITVYVDKDTQLKRLMARNDLSQSEALSRIHSQMSLEDKKQKSDVVINNSLSISELYEQIDYIIQEFKLKRFQKNL